MSQTCSPARDLSVPLIQRSAPERRAALPWRWALVVWAFSLVLVFSRSMHAEVDVDEHPFVASGALLARHGLIPYRDYHYNHMPTEVMIYAGLFRACSRLLLAARCFQVVCAATAPTVLFCLAYQTLGFFSARARLVVSAGAALFLVTNPLFIKTAGLSWNHDFPLLAALLALLALRRSVKGFGGATLLAVLSGYLLGLAVTTRLTFAAALPGFAVLVFLSGGLSRRRKAGLLVAMGLGFVLVSLPAVWVWMQAPRAALFGNFLYPRLNTRIHELRDRHREFTALPILAYYLRNLVYLPGNGIVTITFVALVVRAFIHRAQLARHVVAEISAVVVVVAGLIASGFMPAPPYPQYFYAASPFILVGIILCLGAMPELARLPWAGRGAFAALVLCIGFAAGNYRGLAFLPRPSTWVPLQVHQVGLEVARKARAGTVLTLEPIFPLEGGLDVDERLTTCRFGLRVAPMLELRDRQAYRMPVPLDLPSLLRERHASVLIIRITDWRLDRVLERAADDAGYEKVRLTKRGDLWRPPQPSATVPNL